MKRKNRMNLTDKFIDDIYEISISDLPEHLYHQAKRCLLDYIGVTLAGAQMLSEKGEKLLSYSDNFGNSTIIGYNQKTNLENAIFINGVNAHYPELDDGVNSGIVHPGTPIFSALLPLVEKEKIEDKKLLKAVIIGYEVIIRLANTIQPAHKQLGYHATGTCGTIGVAVAIAVLLDFSKSQLFFASSNFSLANS